MYEYVMIQGHDGQPMYVSFVMTYQEAEAWKSDDMAAFVRQRLQRAMLDKCSHVDEDALYLTYYWDDMFREWIPFHGISEDYIHFLNGPMVFSDEDFLVPTATRMRIPQFQGPYKYLDYHLFRFRDVTVAVWQEASGLY